MVDSIIQEAILNELGHLPIQKQQQVLEYAVSLRSTRPNGTPARELLKFAGTINSEDCESMQEAIEEAFEKVDPNEW
jgi:hypothetical protein